MAIPDFMSPGEVPNDRGRWLIHGPQGSGKLERYGTPILTPRGWVPIENLVPGDTVVGRDGKPQMLLAVFDHGVQPLYRVTMNDGGFTDAGGPHLWTGTNRKGQEMILSTLQVRDMLNRGGSFSIPRVDPVEHPTRELPVPPYMLGGLLADGHLPKSGSIRWTKNSQEVADEMGRSAAEGGWTLRETTHPSADARSWRFDQADGGANISLGSALADLGLRVPSGEKFIPEEYLIASVEQRRDLLAGLFDGDGRLSGKGQRLYHSTSERLARDVQTLCWSLGIGANLHRRKTDGTWSVGLTTPYDPFRASGSDIPATGYHEARRIVSIERVEDGEARCLYVSNLDHLYVTKDYIVTHNTTLASTLAMAGKMLFVDFVGEKGTRSFKGAPYEDNITITRPTSITDLDDLFWMLDSGDHDFQVVVLDSLTAIQKMTMRFLLGHDETAVKEIQQGTAPADIRTWGQSLDIMVDTATFWYGLADGNRPKPIHVVMTAQTKIIEDEETGTLSRRPDVQNGALSITLATPDYILYTDVEENMDALGDETEPPMHHIVRFGSHPGYRTKARLPHNLRGKVPPILGRKSAPNLTSLSRVLGIGGIPAATKKKIKENNA